MASPGITSRQASQCSPVQAAAQPPPLQSRPQMNPADFQASWGSLQPAFRLQHQLSSTAFASATANNLQVSSFWHSELWRVCLQGTVEKGWCCTRGAHVQSELHLNQPCMRFTCLVSGISPNGRMWVLAVLDKHICCKHGWQVCSATGSKIGVPKCTQSRLSSHLGVH